MKTCLNCIHISVCRFFDPVAQFPHELENQIAPRMHAIAAANATACCAYSTESDNKAKFVKDTDHPKDDPETCWVFQIHDTEPPTIARYKGRLPITLPAWGALGIDRRAHYVDAILTHPALWEILHMLPILEASNDR